MLSPGLSAGLDASVALTGQSWVTWHRDGNLESNNSLQENWLLFPMKTSCSEAVSGVLLETLQ